MKMCVKTRAPWLAVAAPEPMGHEQTAYRVVWVSARRGAWEGVCSGTWATGPSWVVGRGQCARSGAWARWLSWGMGGLEVCQDHPSSGATRARSKTAPPKKKEGGDGAAVGWDGGSWLQSALP